jgi:hypothetical protein
LQLLQNCVGDLDETRRRQRARTAVDAPKLQLPPCPLGLLTSLRRRVEGAALPLHRRAYISAIFLRLAHELVHAALHEELQAPIDLASAGAPVASCQNQAGQLEQEVECLAEALARAAVGGVFAEL